jgi:hypothetical protein
MAYDLQIRLEGLVDDQQSLAGRDFYGLIDDNERGSGVQTGVIILGVIDEYKIAFLYFMYLVDARSLTRCIAKKLCAQELTEPPDRYRRWKSHRQYFL